MPCRDGRRVEDVDMMRDISDDVRATMPDETRQSKKIVEDRERIVQEARQEADGIIKQAERCARGPQRSFCSAASRRAGWRARRR